VVSTHTHAVKLVKRNASNRTDAVSDFFNRRW